MSQLKGLTQNKNKNYAQICIENNLKTSKK
jgi:hypothetical protein